MVDNDDLPIGSYRYWFDFPEAFAGRETYLYFGSIAGAATIYVMVSGWDIRRLRKLLLSSISVNI